MNFLSSAFSSLTGTSIPYTFKEKVVDPSTITFPDSRSIWTVYNGINPKNDTPVSIFEYSLKDSANVQWQYGDLARNCLKKLKLIKFPGIISIVDYIENDTYLYIVTEQVVPLGRYLSANKGKISADAKLYGIHSVAHALLFINMKAQCLHGHLDISSSVFVNAQGEWKLFGFELLTNLASDPDQPIYRLSSHLPSFKENLPDEVANGGIEAIRPFPIKYDSYRLAVFIFSLLTSQNFDDAIVVEHSQVLAGSSQIPKALAAPLKRLASSKPNLRITVEKFVQETGTFFSSNRLVTFSHLLDEMKFQSDEEKLAFFKHDLPVYIDDEFPPGYLDNRLLPEIVAQFKRVANAKPTVASTPELHLQRQETISVLLSYILKLGMGLDGPAFAKNVKPIIFHAFTLLDRSIRLTLLNYLPKYCQQLTDSEVQNKVFYNLLTGFQDTNFLIRETTLTSITVIIDKVSVKQVNQDLLKVLAKLQMDPKPSIRTNTLILITRISSKIYAQSRNNVVITALSKSLRDPFTPCKMKALSGFEELLDDFSLDEICGKILGHLAVALKDTKSHKVRMEAKRIFQLYFDSVEKHAATLPKVEEDEDAQEKEFLHKHAPTAPSEEKNGEPADQESSGALSFGWSVMNKLVSSSAVDGELDKSFNASTPDLTRVSTPGVVQEPPKNEWLEEEELDLEDDGWGADEVEIPVLAPKAKPTKPPTINKPAQTSRGLKLGGARAQRKPGSTLKLNLEMEEDDSWGGDW